MDSIEMSEDVKAEMQMALVRVCRNETKASSVWFQMEKIFPEYSRVQIQDAVRPAIKRMMSAVE